MVPGVILDSVPHVNQAARIVREDDGGAQIEIPIRRPRYLLNILRWLLPFSDVRRVRLDALGMTVLNLCDGRRRVEDIIETFAAQNRLTFREAQVSVLGFLGSLTQRGIIVIVGSPAPSAHERNV